MASSTTYWNPQTPMGRFDPSREPVIVRGEGAYIIDQHGRRYFDAPSGLWYANIGHADPRMADAIGAQARVLETYHTFGGSLHQPVLDLSARLAEISPIPDPKILLGSGGSDAVDLALKLARRYWQVVGRPSKTFVLSRERSYHGLHGFGTSVVGEPEMREGCGSESLIPETARVSATDVSEVERAILRIGPENIAAMIAEPIIGSGGVVPPRPGYLAGLRALADRYDFLLVLDEVITGFGRTGRWFAAQRYGVEPDLLTFAKGVTSGYVPLGGVFASRKVWEPFWDPRHPETIYRHGLTYSGHALACAAALKNLEILEHDGLIHAAASLEDVLRTSMHAALDPLPEVREVRVEGLMGAVELIPGLDVREVATTLRDDFGVYARPLAPSIAVSPPFISTPEEIRTLSSALREAIRRHGPAPRPAPAAHLNSSV